MPSPLKPTRLDTQMTQGTHCQVAGMVESLRLTRRKMKRPMPLILLNIIRIDGKYHSRLSASWLSGTFAVQVSYRNGCDYGHYMIMFVTPRKVILFDSGDCVNTKYERPIRKVLDGLGVSQTLDVWRLAGVNKGCHQCSLWTAYGYYIASTRSFERLWQIINLKSSQRQSFLKDFHEKFLDGLPYTPYSRPRSPKPFRRFEKAAKE